MTPTVDIVIKSLSAAAITGIILVVTKLTNKKIAGVIGGIPIVYAISYVLLTLENKKLSENYLKGEISGTIATVIFRVLLLIINKHSPQTY